MSNHDIPRQPHGQPTGGQFAETQRAPAGIALGLEEPASVEPEPTIAPQVFGAARQLAARIAYHQMVDAREKYEKVALAMNAHSERAKAAYDLARKNREQYSEYGDSVLH